MDQARDAQSVHPSTSTLKVNNRLRLPFAAWVGHWSRVDLPLLQPPREGVVISLDFLQKKSRISYYSLHVLDSGHYMCHAISTTGATLNAASPWYRPSYAPRLPPSAATHLSFTSPSLVFTLHSSTTGHWCTPTTIETLATRFAAR